MKFIAFQNFVVIELDNKWNQFHLYWIKFKTVSLITLKK